MHTYDLYEEILNLFKKSKYEFKSFSSEKPNASYEVYLRHDVDQDFLGAYQLAEIENRNEAHSIFFFQPNNNYYNIMSYECFSFIKEINRMGHEIGLHIDASLFKSHEELVKYIHDTYDYYSNYLPITNTISFHCPSSYILDHNIKIDGFINTYEYRFFKDIKYFSDSNRRIFWNNHFYESIERGLSIQLLTHPFWWAPFDQSIYEAYNNFFKKIQNYITRSIKRDKGSIAKIASWLDSNQNSHD